MLDTEILDAYLKQVSIMVLRHLYQVNEEIEKSNEPLEILLSNLLKLLVQPVERRSHTLQKLRSLLDLLGGKCDQDVDYLSEHLKVESLIVVFVELDDSLQSDLCRVLPRSS